MKILYLITQADGGGAQNYTLALARHFRGAIAAGSEAGELFQAAEESGLATFKLRHLKRNISPYHDLLAMWEIRQLLQAYQPEVLHLNSSKAGILGSFASIGLKTKVVFTAHGFVFNEPLAWPIKAFYLALETEASRHRDRIIAVSEADRQAALQYRIAAPDKIAVVHNGLPPLDFLPAEAARQELGLPPEVFLFATIANFYKTKGLPALVEAASLLKAESLSKCRFVLLGSGPTEAGLKSQISRLGLENRFILLGKKDRAWRYLKAFDAFILPSLKEGLPYALLEAAQAGLPILAAPVGGIPEVLGENGFYSPPGNAPLLAGRLKELLRDPRLRERLASAALARSQLFTQDKMLAETQKIYEQLLAS